MVDEPNEETIPNGSSSEVNADLSKFMDSLFASKEERRRELARLPIEKKIEILVQLQKMAQGIPDTWKNVKREPWQVPWKL